MQRSAAQHSTTRCSIADKRRGHLSPATNFKDQDRRQGGRAAVAVLQRRATIARCKRSAASQPEQQLGDDGLLHGSVHSGWLVFVVCLSELLVDGRLSPGQGDLRKAWGSPTGVARDWGGGQWPNIHPQTTQTRSPRPIRSDLAEKFGRMQPCTTLRMLVGGPRAVHGLCRHPAGFFFTERVDGLLA